MSFLKRFTRHSEFIENVATMMSGRTVAAIIALVTIPIVARLFEPADFGVAAIFVSITGIAITMSSLRYELALVLPKHEADAEILLGFTYRVLTCFCLAVLLLIAVYRGLGANVEAVALLGEWIWLLPLSIWLMGAIEIQESWLARRKEFKTASIALVAGNTSTSVARIGFGAVWGSSAWGLVSGYLIGGACRCAVQQRASGSVPYRRVFTRIGWRELREVARRYSDFPRLNTPAAVIFSLGQNLPVLLFGAMFSPAIVGYYAMAYRLTEVPVSIVANSMRKVFLQKAAEINLRQESLRNAFLLATGGLAVVGAIPFVILALFGQVLLVWLLGERWLVAGTYLEIMAALLFMNWVASPTGPVFIVLRKQQAWLYLQMAMTALRLGSFGVAYALGADAEWTLKAFVLATVLGYVAEMVGALAMISRNSQAILPSEGEAG